jgi:hypothetical protein
MLLRRLEEQINVKERPTDSRDRAVANSTILTRNILILNNIIYEKS